MLAIIIKTFNRDITLLNTLRSIEKFCQVNYRIYILDDSPVISKQKQAYYTKLEEEGHFIKISNERISVTAGRNYLVSQIRDEKYVLRIDDDFEFSEETNLGAMIEIMEHDTSIGTVASIEKQVGNGKGIFTGQISPKQGFTLIKDHTLIKKNIPVTHWKFLKSGKGYRYALCDFSRNFLMIRATVFKTLKWDENIPFHGEHEDFMLEVNKNGWKLAFTPDSIHLHREDLSVSERATYKKDIDQLGAVNVSEEYFFGKWGFTKRKDEYPNDYLLWRKISRARHRLQSLLTK